MKQDMELIVHKLGLELPYINIYPIGDVHVGSELFDQARFKEWIAMVKSDPYGYVVIVGDMVDNGLKNSKTNCYEAVMRPREQKEYLKRALAPISNKILGAVRGNHEERSVKETDDCPLYDVMSKLDIEDLYRENMAFIKVNLGQRALDRQVSYVLTLAHGGSRSKTDKFSYAFDGVDIFVTGHIHQPSDSFPSKIVVDTKNETIREVGMIHATVPTFQKTGGYTLRGLYMPCDQSRIPIIRLDGKTKRSEIKWI